MRITLNQAEMDILFQQQSAGSQGGFQNFLENLQNRTDRMTGELELTEADLEKIPRYAFDYQSGGWQGRLTSIFERHLGANLGR